MAPPPVAGAGGSAGGTFDVHGTVVDGVTGKGIARALVISADRRLATMTNSEGAFSLEVTVSSEPGLNPAQMKSSGPPLPEIYFMAQRPGYMAYSTRPVGVPLDASAKPEPIVLKLMPGATVVGHVFDGHNEGAHRVTVDLMMRSMVNGERMWNQVATHRTDADGNYRFADLAPGEYTVMTEEWRGEQPLPPQRDAVTEQYPPVFLGEGADLASAHKLALHYGDAAQADLTLHTATYYPVSVPIAGSGGGFVNVRITGAEGISGFRLGYVPNRQAVEGSLPNGSYHLELTGYPQPSRQPVINRLQTQQLSYGSTELHVEGGAVRAAPVTMLVPGPLTVRVHREFSGKDVPPRVDARVYLQPTEQGRPFLNGNTDEEHEREITLPGAAPGQYSVHVEPSYGYAAEVRCGGTDLRAEKLTVGAGGSQPVDVVLRDDTATVEGAVTGGNATRAPGAAGPIGAFVVLTPVKGEGRFNIAGTGQDGRFSMSNVAPGSYRAFAIDFGAWNEPGRDPESLRNLGDIGVALTVSSNGTQQVEVPLLNAAALEPK